MSERLRVGVIGTGFIGTVHAHAVRAAGAELAVVAASTPERSAEAARRLGAGRGASAEDVVAAEDVDVVHVASPDETHVPLAWAAIAAGKAVICEKPLATELDAARALADFADAQQAVTAVPFVYRFYPTVREARARIAAGDAGALHLLYGGYLQDWQLESGAGWRGEGGAGRTFADVGIHWCDLAEFVTGHRMTWLLARLASDRASVTIVFATDKGASGSATISQAAVGRKNQLAISIDGDRASYAFDQEEPETLTVRSLEGTLALPRGSTAMGEEASAYNRIPAGHPQGYQDCFNAFVTDTYRAVTGHRPDGLPGFADGLRAAVLTDAVVTSATSSAWVAVTPTSRQAP